MDIIWVRADTPPQRLSAPITTPDEGFLWFDFTRDEADDWPAVLERSFGAHIHDRHLADTTNLAHPSFYDATSDYEMVIFRSLASETEEGLFASRPTSFFLFPQALVTVQSGDSRSITAVKQRLLAQSGRTPQVPAGLLHAILNAMVDRFLALRESLALQMESWTEGLLDPRHPFSDWQLVMRQRSQLRRLEILCDEQEDAIIAWRDNTRYEVSEHLEVRFTDLLEHVRRVTKFAVTQQHEVESLVQLHFSAVAHRTNEIVRVLTVLSAIFLPLTLITGIYGMNFDRMPELHSPNGYFFTLGGMLLLAVALLAWFRVKKWF